MATDSGYSNQKMRGRSRHQTVQTMGSDRVGVPTAQMYLYEKTPVAISVVSVTKVPDKAGQPDTNRLLIEFDGAHNAKKFDVMRMMNGVLEGWEFEILKVVDATKVHVYNIGDVEGVEQLPQAADQVKTLRWTTALSDQSGALQVSQGPLQFVKDGATSTVVKDTAVPANTNALPVEIIGLGGNPININTDGDVNFHTSSEGANPDSVRIGDGSGVFQKINGDGSINALEKAEVVNEATMDAAAAPDAEGSIKNLRISEYGMLFVRDLWAYPRLASIINSIDTMSAKFKVARQIADDSTAVALSFEDKGVLDSIDNHLTNMDGYEQSMAGAIGTDADAKELNPDAVQTGLNALARGQLQKLLDVDTKLGAEAVLVGPVNEAAPATDIADSGLNGRLQRIAQRISSLIGLLPVSLGQKNMAGSLAVTIASDQASIPVVTTENPLAITYQEITNLTNVAQTFVAPAGTKWMLIETDEANVANVRVKIGAAATVASGIQFQPGRSETLKGGGNISVIAESGVNNKVFVQFGA